jgi:hypothetical protein
LRIFDVDRRITTVSPEVQKYCLLSKGSTQFAEPTKSDIMKSKVVVTTLVTSLILGELDVKGLFTHIFVDEAAQVCILQIVFYQFNGFRIVIRHASHCLGSVSDSLLRLGALSGLLTRPGLEYAFVM